MSYDVCVIGLGRVGLPLALSFADAGLSVLGVDNDPDVLVFDEATSALDNQTENAIVRAIEELRGLKTLIVVAHRLSTVRSCNRLVLLQNGRVIGAGSFENLVAVHPALRDMMVSGVS